MRPTPDDVLTALELVASRVPDRHITPDSAMALSWFEDLARYDRAAVFRAAREWGGLRFPAASEFIAAVREAAKAVAEEEAAKYAAGALDIGTCTEGCETGWIFGELTDGGVTYTTVRPCELCAPITYAVWRHRTAVPNHDPDRCPDCIAVRKNRDPLPDWIIEARELATRRRQPVEQF